MLRFSLVFLSLFLTTHLQAQLIPQIDSWQKEWREDYRYLNWADHVHADTAAWLDLAIQWELIDEQLASDLTLELAEGRSHYDEADQIFCETWAYGVTCETEDPRPTDSEIWFVIVYPCLQAKLECKDCIKNCNTVRLVLGCNKLPADPPADFDIEWRN